MAKRRNKTYEQQKKFYDGSNNYESLGALFFYWLTCGNSSNRTFMELKLMYYERYWDIHQCSNRTFMELKLFIFCC